MPDRARRVVAELGAGVGSWPMAIVLLSFVAVISLYTSTFRAMAEIWLRSDTFAHGLIVVPLALFLIYRQRYVLRASLLQPVWQGLLVIVFLVFVWFIANRLSINALEQFAAVALIPAAIGTLGGPGVVRPIMFALGFLFFAVPFGEFVIPVLMEITADLSTIFLRLTGFPVYREGLFIAVPGGDFEIAKACSGIRYLIASVVLGTIFAYLTYTSWRKRLIFIAFAVAVPIVANGIRAYLIVVLASVSGMKLAVGVDHFIYGWVFFGIVMFVLFGVGVRYRDPDSPPAATSIAVANKPGIAMLLATLAVLAAGPAVRAIVDPGATAVHDAKMMTAPDGWTEVTIDAATGWSPAFSGSDLSLRRALARGDTVILEYIDIFDSEGADAASSGNRLVDNETWRLAEELRTDDRDFRVVAATSGRRKIHILSWYQIGNTRTASPFSAKLAELRNLLLGGSNVTAIVAFATVDDKHLEELLAYVSQHEARVSQCIVAATEEHCVD